MYTAHFSSSGEVCGSWANHSWKQIPLCGDRPFPMQADTTRMHSSRMHTTRSSNRPWGGLQQPLRRRHPLGGSTSPEGSSPPLLTESQMPVKILPCPNFVAGGNHVGRPPEGEAKPLSHEQNDRQV